METEVTHYCLLKQAKGDVLSDGKVAAQLPSRRVSFWKPAAAGMAKVDMINVTMFRQSSVGLQVCRSILRCITRQL